MTEVIVDVPGLTRYGTFKDSNEAFDYARSVCPVGDYLDAGNRVHTLATLVAGSGYTVYTGPEGAWFWAAVSPEVKVRVVPDDYEFKPRVEPNLWWALRVVGLGAADAGRLSTRKTPVPERDRCYSDWLRAGEVLRALASCGSVEPLIATEYRIEQWDLDAVITSFASDEFKALDGEWDIETGEPAGLSIGTAETAAYLPLLASDIEATDEARKDRGFQAQDALSSYLRSGRPAVMHGGRADLDALFLGDPLDLVGVADLDDTMVMAYLCGEPVLALKDLTRKFLDRDPTDFPGNLSDLSSALGTRYAAADSRNTYDLFAVFGRTLAERNLLGVYASIERPLVPVIASMERYGVPLDLTEVARLYRDTVAIEQGVRYAILDNYGYDVARDGKSDNQALAFVTSAIGYNPGKLDQRILTMFPQGKIDLLLLHRRSRTLRRNFLGRALRYMYAATKPQHVKHLFKSRKRFTAKGKLTDLGKFLEWKRKWERSGAGQFRYFSRFNQAGNMDGDNAAAPRSGRLSSSGDINFQQQSRAIRSIYVPPEGCDWFSWDYSGLELHIAASVSGDPMMRKILEEVCPDGKCTHKPKHGDLHGYLQYKVQEMTGQVYERAMVVKPFNFMELYGGSPSKGVEIVAKSRNYITIETAKEIDAGHHALFPGFWRWREAEIEENRRKGYAETIFGRRRYIPEYRSSDPERRSYADRAGVNHEIQGAAADIVKIAMFRVVPVLRKYGAHMCAQVHDELDGWIPKTADHDGFKREIEEILTGIELPGGIKLKVEGGFGNSWAEAH